MIVPPIFLYAETHYRFKYFFSFLKKREPEILADAPHRIDPDVHLPILLLVKDADQYPISLLNVEISLSHNGKKIHRQMFQPEKPILIETHYWWKIIEVKFIDDLEDTSGVIRTNIDFTILQNGKIKKIKNNNHRTSSKTSLLTYRSKTHLPTIPGWFFGDTHTHSTYTEDQVEFGAPISAGPKLCRAMGLRFFCVTDHSYDLDDRTDNYLINDPAIPKWHQMHKEISEINNLQKEFVVIRGEEVSCTNSDNHNVHLLLIGTQKFFHGSGDSAEKWFRTQCEHSVNDVLVQREPSVAAYAGHPTEEVPFLQRLLINRGEWTKRDMGHQDLHGIQILNGEFSEHFINGMDVWKWLLLRGDKKFIAAGNDAHGNYNRFVQIGIPFFAIREKESQLFGKMKTALFASLSEQSIISALQNGRSVITNGPVVIIEIETDTRSIGKIGETVSGKKFLIKVQAKSTQEFGRLKTIKLFHGTIGKKEKEFLELRKFHNHFHAHFITEWESVTNFSYIRAEATTKDGEGIDENGFCFTNPIWIQPA